MQTKRKKRLSIHNTMGKYFTENLLQSEGVKEKDVEEYFNVKLTGRNSGLIFSSTRNAMAGAAMAKKPIDVVFLQFNSKEA